MKTSFKNLWCIVSPSGEINITSLNWQKNMAIAWFIDGAPIDAWKEYKQNGWDCIKVNVSINPIIK